MPRKSRVPSYVLHRASGRAVVRIDGKDHYLGKYGSSESHQEYSRRITEWQRRPVGGDDTRRSGGLGPAINLTVNELLLRYLRYAEGYYVADDGSTTSEFRLMIYAGKPLRKLYGHTLVRDFGPLSLKAIQQQLIDSNQLCRSVINKVVNRIRRIFKWAVSEELAPPGLYHALQTVAPLRAGRSSARETQPVEPVPLACVEATLPGMTSVVAAMVRVQLLAGMRPGEVIQMRPQDIDRTGEVWVYRPAQHKNQWRGHCREICLGPLAQGVLTPFLNRPPGAFVFSPQEAEAERNADRRRDRKSPMTPSQAVRRPKAKPARAKRDRYDVGSYRRAIDYAVKKINRGRADEGLAPLPTWSPLQLRHSRATEVRKAFGLEGSQAALGHKHAAITEIYAERDRGLAARIAAELG